MKLTGIRAQGVRNLKGLDWKPGPGINLITGDNGAGKTSLLEAICLLSRGRSFRTGYSRPVMSEGEKQIEISGRTEGAGSAHQLGMRKSAGGWVGKIDGREAAGQGELARYLPTLVFEPGSHAMVEGPPEGRRRFLDWGVFHVEPGYGRLVQQYRKALKQRNAALRSGNGPAAWAFDGILISSGEEIAIQRDAYAERLIPVARQVIAQLNQEIDELSPQLDRGWPRDQALGEALKAHREQDLRSGHTGRGPHRAELRLRVANRAAAEYLSRGQQKVLGLSLILAQAQTFHVEQGEAPILLLDDLASELDPDRLGSSLSLLQDLKAQVMVTMIRAEAVSEALLGMAQRFHVEHGNVQPVV